MNERDGYGFSLEDKQYARDRANGHCEFGNGTCNRKNSGRVNHLTGCYQGKLQGTPKEWVSNIRENSAMMCELHEAVHDREERLAIEEILYERPRFREVGRRRNRRTQLFNQPRHYEGRR